MTTPHPYPSIYLAENAVQREGTKERRIGCLEDEEMNEKQKKGKRDPLTPQEHSITNCSFVGLICPNDLASE